VSETILRGPADADHYRVQVGRFKERWYADPLPADDVWGACEEVFPSVSTVKKASGSDWSFVSIKRIGDAGGERLRQIADLPDGERHDALRSLDRRGLEQAAQRGTNVHSYIEARLRGLSPMLITAGMPGYEWIGAVEQFLDTYQPELVAAEYVTIHRTLNGVGYGGTPDADIRIGGELLKVDWKTRGVESSHGAYPEEAAQLAASAFAEYMIVEHNPADDPFYHGAVRRPIPKFDGGIIVSIKPDGVRVYPVDLDRARAHWERLHAWWCARRDERDPIGKPWAPGKAPKVAKPTRPDPHANAKSLGVAPPPVAVTVAPDEGPTVDLDALRARYKAAPEEHLRWIAGIRAQAVAAGVDIHLADHPTMRRARIMDGLLTLVEAECHDDDAVRALVREATGDDAVEWPTVAVGVAVGSMGAAEADAFRTACEMFVTDRYRLLIEADGPRLVAA
jgi:hypothetical protein